jgi:hypothetical protein
VQTAVSVIDMVHYHGVKSLKKSCYHPESAASEGHFWLNKASANLVSTNPFGTFQIAISD